MTSILIIEDDEQLGRMVKDWLEIEEYTVNLVLTGMAGWKELQEGEYDIVLLDWDLPDIDGIDILKKVRIGGNMIPIIMLTGRKAVDEKEVGLDQGANDYLTKPYHFKELTARIRNVLRSQQPKVDKPLGSSNTDLLKAANLIGTSLPSKYEFLELIGEGGMALVFKVRHPHLQKVMAIKMLQACELKDNAIARFEREAQIISRLDHPNIVTVSDFGVTENRQPYMVMEYIAGKSLDAILEEKEELPLAEMLDILDPVCSALAYAHKNEILHRDVKPGNIMLKSIDGSAPIPKILDFGLARLRTSEMEKAPALTQANVAMGSPPYMSPEQVRGSKLDERSDIYSLACVIFEVLTGYVPFCATTASEIMTKRLEEPPLTLAEARPDLSFPASVQAVLHKALQKQPDLRYQSVLELREALRELR